MSSLKTSIIKGTMWSMGGHLVVLLLMFGTNIWLAHILSPEEFGQIGIVMFFILIANIFVEGGLGGALVRKPDVTEEDYSTVFVFNLLVSVLLFSLLLFSSNAIGNFYEDPHLVNFLDVTGSVLIINSFQLTQNAKLTKELKFKQRSIYKFIAVFVASAVGIIFAMNGFGVWSLVIIQILTALINTILLWVFEGFYLSFCFSKKSFKNLYAFGLNTSVASILSTAFDNIYQLVLGKYFSIAQTGYYYQAKRLQDVPGSLVNMVSQGVIFSSLAKLQESPRSFVKAYNKIALYFVVFLAFVSLFIFLYSKEIIFFLYGRKWEGAVFYMQLLTLASFFYLQENVNRVIFKVFDKTRTILHLEYVKKIIQIISILIGVYFLNLGILLVGFVITNILSYLLNFFYSRRVMNVSNLIELLSVTKTIAISVCCGGLIYLLIDRIKLFQSYNILTLPILLILYFGGLNAVNVFDVKKEFRQLLSVLKK